MFPYIVEQASSIAYWGLGRGIVAVNKVVVEI